MISFSVFTYYLFFLSIGIVSSSSASSLYPNVYYSIFAGRREILSVHLVYTDILLTRNLVTEVHIWDQTRNIEDCEYINAYIRDTDVHGYKIYKRGYNDQFIDKNTTNGYFWGKYYSHYSKSKLYTDNDILIKADDDIVFLDISRFKKFILATSNDMINMLHFPLIINNDVSTLITGHRKLRRMREKNNKRYTHDITIRMLKHYVDLGLDYNDMFQHYKDRNQTNYMKMRLVCPVSSIYCNSTEVEDIWGGGLFHDGVYAYKHHLSFINNPMQYIEDEHDDDRFEYIGKRISVNMFAGRMENIRTLYTAFLSNHQCCDDEGYIGKVPTLFNTYHVIDTHMTIAHLSFHPQNSTGTMSEILNEYKLFTTIHNGSVWMSEYSNDYRI